MKRTYAKFTEANIDSIRAGGWLREYLDLQRSGLTGHIEVAGYPFDRISWGKSDEENVQSGSAPGWWAFEQTGYHLDGMTRLGILTRDRTLKQKAKKIFDFVLQNADPDGYLGPKFLKKSDGWNRWPHVVFFRALLAHYEDCRDKRILAAIEKHYLGSDFRHDRARDVINVEIMLRVYLAGGSPELLTRAKEDFASYNANCRDDNCAAAQLSPRKAYAHGVTYNEYSKLGALLYTCTGDKTYLKPSVNAYRKIDRFQMLPDGAPCSDEFLLDNDYMQAHETCDITDYTWALHYMLASTGKGEYADKIERCILNAGIGAVWEDFRALQYFSCCNQLVLDRTSNHCDFLMGDKWLSYRPNPGTECCAGNVNRFFPNFCTFLWMRRGRGIAAVLYGASTFTFGSGKTKVTVTESTDFPFDDRVTFTFSMKQPRRFPFFFRLPGWCKTPAAYLNGQKIDLNAKDGFARLDALFKEGDRLVLDLPAEFSVKKLPAGLCYIERGPLLFTYGMAGRRSIDEKEKNQSPDFPAYNITPDKPFNYALVKDQPLSLVRTQPGKRPFSLAGAPYSLRVLARRVPSWKITRKTKIFAVHNLYTRPWKREEKNGSFTFTPRCPSPAAMKKAELGPTETITLVPYAAAKVRVTVFPTCEKE